ncbi:MAG: hypothetical protein EOO96_27780 [Pedobacter sp.]|nr:MAG: hypothetical protein EOO96_27780 [Pedobacter sp.]
MLAFYLVFNNTEKQEVNITLPLKKNMSYFGGLGAGKGWNTFNFILTPAEFELLFEDLQFNFVIDNQRVEIGYRQTDRDYIFGAYKRFFEEMLIGEKERSKKEKWDIEAASEFL